MSRPVAPPVHACLVAMLCAAALTLCAGPLHAQTFVRITDPANPVITDNRETGGGSWEDVNGDGLLDLFAAYGNLTNQNDGLYLNLGGMNFLKVVTGPVVTKGGASIGGCWGDWDADGLPDLWVTNRTANGNFLFHGLGDTTFADVTTGDPITDRANGNSSSWVDADGDGDLDLYVLNFGANDFFYLNSGSPSWTLTRTALTGIGVGGEASINAVWADFDNDGDPDIFIGNAGDQNDDLGINQGGLVFTKRVIPDAQSTLGASWGDFDNDGDLDLFAANFLGQASILYRNDGAPLWNLTPVTTAVFPTYATNAVGSAWGDVDNDGDLDLVTASQNASEALFLNSGPPSYTFTRVLTGDLTTDGGTSFGCSLADIDRDGDLDLFVANTSNENDFLFRNDGPASHWLTLRLRGTGANKSAIGARVRVLATIGGVPRWQTRELAAQTGYNSQNPELHFGLGDALMADSVDVRWPDGAHEVSLHVTGDRWLELFQGQPVGVPFGNHMAGGLAIRSITPNPGRGVLRVSFVVPRAGAVRIEMFDLLGRRIGARELPASSAGEQSIQLAAGALPASVYVVRLTQGSESVSARAVVTR
jgi:hypothetical protein